MKTKIIQLLFVFTLLSSAAFAQSNNLSHWYGSAYAEDQEVSMFTSIKFINWFYYNPVADTEDLLSQTWPALNADQIGHNFLSTQDFEDYLYNTGLDLIDIYYIEQATVTMGSNTIQDAIDADHPVLARHGYNWVTITGYDTGGYTYWDPVTASGGHDTFGNFYDTKEITGVL